jgi:hypothetical protein
VGKIDERFTVFLSANPDTLSAKNASIGVIDDEWVARVERLPLGGQAPELFRPFELDLDFAGDFLELALLVLPAGAAIKVVIPDEQLVGSSPDPVYFRRLCTDDQAFSDGLRA